MLETLEAKYHATAGKIYKWKTIFFKKLFGFTNKKSHDFVI
jgi:hypothetical protein